jgi:hypothetical protein
MPLTAEVPPRDRAVLLAGPAGPAPAPGAGFTRWIRAWRRIGCTGTCRIYCGTRIRRGLCGDAAAAGYGDAGFIPCLIQPGMMRPGTAGLRGRSVFRGRSGQFWRLSRDSWLPCVNGERQRSWRMGPGRYRARGPAARPCRGEQAGPGTARQGIVDRQPRLAKVAIHDRARGARGSRCGPQGPGRGDGPAPGRPD